jgi:flagellar biosynthetic protein FliO
LIVIIALIVLTLNVMKRLVRPGGNGGSGQSPMQVVGTLFLEPKKGIYLVKVVDRLLILGVTDGGISILEKVPEGPEMERLEKAVTGSRHLLPQNFADKLRNALKKQHISN